MIFCTVSTGCISALSNKEHYSTFVRTIPVFTSVAPFFKTLLELYDWQRVAIVSSIDHVWQVTANAVTVSILSS